MMACAKGRVLSTRRDGVGREARREGMKEGIELSVGDGAGEGEGEGEELEGRGPAVMYMRMWRKPSGASAAASWRGFAIHSTSSAKGGCVQLSARSFVQAKKR